VLTAAIAQAEVRIRERRSELDAQAQGAFDLKRAVNEARAKLEDLKGRRAAVDASRPQDEEVVLESYPTPIGKVVLGEEVHFQLRGGRLAFVPIDELVHATRADGARKVDKVLGRSAQREFTDVVGPEGGFQLRYTARRFDPGQRTPDGKVVYGGYQVCLVKWEVIPTTSQLGETVEEALAEGSQFHRRLAGLRQGTAVTVWVYEDSFASFRAIRKEMHRLNIPAAARPLRDGMFIGGSPKGSRSEAE
jgi:hypothetical protein